MQKFNCQKKSKKGKNKRNKRNTRKVITYFQGFAGIGAPSVSLKRVENVLPIKFECVGISEIEPYALKVYQELNGDVKNFFDITKIDYKKLPHFDFLTWSSPCQDASTAGQRKGFTKDSGTKSSLAWYLIPLLKSKKEQNDLPFMICFENVKGILQGKNANTFNEFLDAIKEFGYMISYKVLDANDYGTAQHRERVFVICSLLDVGFEFPQPRKEKVLLKDIIEKEVDTKYLFNSKNPINRSLYHKKDRVMRIHNPNYSTCGFTLSTKGTGRPEDNYFFLEDLGYEEVVRVNLKFLEKYGLSVDELHNAKIRSLTPTEAMRLMGFNNEEISRIQRANLCKTWIYHVMGNSICPPVLEDIFYEYFKCVMQEWRNNYEL